MVSIIVPVYKVEKYLRNCIESIINQTYKNLEIILVDDGSPDNCGELCDQWAKQDKRIKVIHQENRGLAAARNRGLEYAINNSQNNQSHFITFVDSDDSIDPNMYQVMVKAMEDGADIAICRHRIVQETDKLSLSQIKNNISLNNDALWEEVFGRLNNAVWNKLYRADLIGNTRFPVGIIHGEDLLFNIDYLSKCQRGVLNLSQFYNYAKRENSITTGEFNKNKLMEISVKDKAKELVTIYCPKQIDNAEKYCFRARMNILRGIYNSRQEEEYQSEIENCKEYVSKNYHRVKEILSKKEKIEFFLLERVFLVYKILIKIYCKRGK